MINAFSEGIRVAFERQNNNNTLISTFKKPATYIMTDPFRKYYFGQILVISNRLQ